MFETIIEGSEPNIIFVSDSRGYFGRGIKLNDDTYSGYVTGMFRDIIEWTSHNSLGAEDAQSKAIDEYLISCKKVGIEPEESNIVEGFGRMEITRELSIKDEQENMVFLTEEEAKELRDKLIEMFKDTPIVNPLLPLQTPNYPWWDQIPYGLPTFTQPYTIVSTPDTNGGSTITYSFGKD